MTPSTDKNSSILVVEDSRTQAQFLRGVLADALPQYEIEVAHDGVQALEQIAAHRPDLVVSDVVMPKMNGYEMCRQIKEDASLQTIPVVLLTSLSESEDVIKGLNAGTDYYLTKPFEPEFLVSKIEAILADDKPEAAGSDGWRVNFAGKSHLVRVDLQQILNLLLSTYENAVQQNKQLLSAQDELRTMNEGLEERVRERTAELSLANSQLQVEVEERAHAQIQLRIQLERLDALRQIDMAISGSLDLHVTLNVVLAQILSHLHVDAANVLLLRRHSHALEFAASRGFASHSQTTIADIPRNSPAHQAARDRTIVRIDDLSRSATLPRSREVLEAERFTAYMAVPLVSKGRAEGVLEVFHRAPLAETPEWLDFLEALAGQAAIAIDSALLFEDVQRSHGELLNAYDSTLEGWSRALDLRDKETEGHSSRVTEITEMIARHLNVPDIDVMHMRRGALLHDIGKLAVPDSILRKPGPLDAEERAIMERHPVHALEMLSPIAFLRAALDIPYAHHEKWDGTGYPRGLSGEQIPLAARIFAVADVWDALRSTRPYRRGWPRKKVLDYIRSESESHFDSQVVNAFCELMEHSADVVDRLPDVDESEDMELSGDTRNE